MTKCLLQCLLNSPDNDQPPLIPLFHGGDEPPVSQYKGPVTARYSEVKREDMAPHLLVPLVALHALPHTSTAAKGDYSVLRRDDISNVPLHNLTARGDYSVIKRDDVSNVPPYSTSIGHGGDYSILKREERGIS